MIVADWLLLGGSLALFVVIVLFQRRYHRKLQARQRLSDRLWAQVLQDMRRDKKLR